ncbi:hypothetical protein PMAYCL1PPCAC_02846 [Pristionchus mayeri]|uniref:Uncharacterized protein n=1 Tax=Pristionchus mayeri TaxID=1317129 RepID=A0AAN4Z4Y8_9BILA|nr:hypothetical protein PMAYCL1PPCAC_02846 [Pristionchus mayeri]
MRPNTILRLSLKLLELASSVVIIYLVSRVGTQWILLVSLVSVPPFTAYLILKSPSSSSSSSILHLSRRLLKSEGIISTCMAILSAILSLTLAYSHHVLGLDRNLLHACFFSSVLCLFYSIDVFLAFLSYRSAVIHFSLIPPPKIFPESPVSHPLSLTIDHFSSHLPHLQSTRLLTIDHGQLKFVACPSNGHKSRVPRMNPSKGLTQFTLPPPRPEAPQYISHALPDRRLSYSIPPSIDQSSISSSSNSSLSLGDRYHSASTIPQDPNSIEVPAVT